MIDYIHKNDDQLGPFKKNKAAKAIVPICSCCHKIHVDKKSWQHRPLHLDNNVDTVFSHGLCPHCYEEQRIKFQKFRTGPTLKRPATLKTRANLEARPLLKKAENSPH